MMWTLNTVFFPTPPTLVDLKTCQCLQSKCFELHMFSTKKWAPRCAWSGIDLPRPTARCSTTSSLPRTLSSDISPSLLGFPRNDLDMPWLFLGWTPRKMRIFDGNYCCVLPWDYWDYCFPLVPMSVHKLLKCFYHFYLPAAVRSKSIWQVSVVQNTLTKRCFTVS